MAKADSLKEEIGWLKMLGGMFGALNASLIVWLVQNYEATNGMLASATGALIILLSASVAAIVARIYRCFKVLETL